MHSILLLIKGALILHFPLLSNPHTIFDILFTDFPIRSHLIDLAPIVQSPRMSGIFLLAFMAVPNAMAFPWVAGISGIRSSSGLESQLAKRQSTCPFNANHVAAAPITSEFPYAGAQNGLPSTLRGNFQVPANGDTAHAFVAPGPNDIRGPCPGLNTAANHNVGLHPSASLCKPLTR